MNNDNGNQFEVSENRKNLNPFAADEDDDDDSDEVENGEFSIEDVEDEKNDDDDDVGLLPYVLPELPVAPAAPVPPPLSVLNFTSKGKSVPSYKGFGGVQGIGAGGIGRAKFPSLWPFGSNLRGLGNENGRTRRGSEGDELDDEEEETFGDSMDGLGEGDDVWGAFQRREFSDRRERDANVGGVQSDESSDGDEDVDTFEGSGGGLLSSGVGSGKRRLSSTTEAKRRTSLEDDDSDDGEGVVHVKLGEGVEAGPDVEGEVAREVEAEGNKGKDKEEGDGELVEVEAEALQAEMKEGVSEK